MCKLADLFCESNQELFGGECNCEGTPELINAVAVVRADVAKFDAIMVSTKYTKSDKTKIAQRALTQSEMMRKARPDFAVPSALIARAANIWLQGN